MELSFIEFKLWTGMTLEDFLRQKCDYLVEFVDAERNLKMIDGVLCQMRFKNSENEQTIKHFLIRLYFKKTGEIYYLSHLRLLNTDIVTWNTIFPRSEDQDARYIGHLELLQSWYGEPNTLSENEFSYKLDGVTAKCKRELNGKAKFTDGYVNYYFS